jgi:4-hydroxy-3-methylbut-2-enyl diphosphate reductase
VPSEPDLIVAAPLWPEALAVRRSLPAGQVRHTGLGPRRAAAAVPGLRADPARALAVAGVAGALTTGLNPGDLVVANEIRTPEGAIPCPSAPLLAGELCRQGATVHVGPIVCADHVVGEAERAELAATGALAVDMESGVLAQAAGDRPFAVVRSIVDTPGRPLFGPATVTGGPAGLRALATLGPALRAWAAAVGDRRLVLASPRSFCAGVERAIDVVERLLEHKSKPIYVRKQIVHNARVVADLEQRGAVFVEELDEVPAGATVVFSAHGVAPSVREEAEQRELDVVDATCPLVGKVHHEARRYAKQGNTILFIGHAGHEETEGTLGEVPERTILVQDESEVDELRVPDPRRVSYLMQTTLAVDEAAGIVSALRRRFPEMTGPNSDDICYATTNRQQALVAVAGAVDLVLVLGSANSSNSRRLVEVAEREGARAFLVDHVGQVRLDWLADARSIGVSAGASAPPELVDELIDALGGLGRLDTSERRTTTETIRFTLPKEVRY